ncbi:MAG: hypothetical protein IKF72_00925 [Kiritimatiellae bacterium]|nr:hypothetical protein [Kiritimatiellia bacterium]
MKKTLPSIAAAPGIHAKGNDIYVSVAFNEPVTVTGFPSLTTTSWGGGSTTSPAAARTSSPSRARFPTPPPAPFNVTGKSGAIKDLAGNPLGTAALLPRAAHAN